MKNISQIALLLGIAALLSIVAFTILRITPDGSYLWAGPVNSFEECAAAGYPIMESYPEQCRTPDGKTFTRTIATQASSNNGCVIAGCSGQICTEASEAGNVITDCAYREMYGCYKSVGRCERQATGQCGWSKTDELQACLGTYETNGDMSNVIIENLD